MQIEFGPEDKRLYRVQRNMEGFIGCTSIDQVLRTIVTGLRRSKHPLEFSFAVIDPLASLLVYRDLRRKLSRARAEVLNKNSNNR
ncbi:hypothetical protein A2688_02370 [Candidatus Daviesbacteria bacterium RIFCSPHIGHO2_01_FULL_38_8]|nr:MAG: hypothetical protein A2688_02370 [Candidatus Daviesbacteria bacterium RIFCSPHIGHO2_01_FULL_38_8]